MLKKKGFKKSENFQFHSPFLPPLLQLSRLLPGLIWWNFIFLLISHQMKIVELINFFSRNSRYTWVNSNGSNFWRENCDFIEDFTMRFCALHFPVFSVKVTVEIQSDREKPPFMDTSLTFLSEISMKETTELDFLAFMPYNQSLSPSLARTYEIFNFSTTFPLLLQTRAQFHRDF